MWVREKAGGHFTKYFFKYSFAFMSNYSAPMTQQAKSSKSEFAKLLKRSTQLQL